MGKTKKTFELDDGVIATIVALSEYSGIPECDVVEMAIVNPKVLINTLKVMKQNGIKNL